MSYNTFRTDSTTQIILAAQIGQISHCASAAVTRNGQLYLLDVGRPLVTGLSRGLVKVKFALNRPRRLRGLVEV
jgi:hypothetical protein